MKIGIKSFRNNLILGFKLYDKDDRFEHSLNFISYYNTYFDRWSSSLPFRENYYESL